jgi:sterol desaturase/sphingolipid hydroxylase (fatty acid hydroxylase superfamily)
VSEALRARGFGLCSRFPTSSFALVLVAIVALDFANYFAHWLMHRVPALWRVHRVHHSDPLVDVTTSLRQHPFENVLRFSFTIAAAWGLGLPAAAVAVYRLISALNGLFEHANIRLWQPLDGLISITFVTPNMHKVHHSRRQSETDSNYGNIFSLFDRIFGTFTASDRVAHVEYGLDGYDNIDTHRLSRLLKLPFAAS